MSQNNVPQKICFSLLMIFAIPLYCAICNLIPQHFYYFYEYPICKIFFVLIFYVCLIVWCIRYLKNKTVLCKDVVWSLAVGVVTLAYTIPLQIWVIIPAVATGLVFLVCRNLVRTHYNNCVWIHRSLLYNLIILACITLTYFALFMLTPHRQLTFSGSHFIQALAPGISEELIFRVFFPLLIYKHFDVCQDSVLDKVWIFILTAVPFSLIHLICPLTEWNLTLLLRAGLPRFIISAVLGLLCYKFGFIYGMYAHFLWNFLAM